MRLWIDLANSPQVLFFRPLIKNLQNRGHTVDITSRDYAQTIALANHYELEHTIIGNHGGKNWKQIIRTNYNRVSQLTKWARIAGPFDLAVSHNSYAQAIAAKLLNIPFVTLMDYEHQKLNHLCFRLAKSVIVPKPFPDEMLEKFGAKNKSFMYNGLKEQMYLSGFEPDSKYSNELGLSTTKVITVIRPPAPWATYHRFENSLFDKIIDFLAGNETIQIVFLPRVNSQADTLRSCHYENVIIPHEAVDGPNLLYLADLVISGGGTMNREAAILGTPAYTVFKGKLGSVDHYLIERGQLFQIENEMDFEKIRIRKKYKIKNQFTDCNLIDQVVDLIIN